MEKATSVEIFDRSNSKASRPPMYYNLDVIISVGYRVKSQRGVQFRRWATRVLKDFIIRGYAVNDTRIKQLGEVVRLMKRTQDSLDSRQVLSVIESYSTALDLLFALLTYRWPVQACWWNFQRPSDKGGFWNDGV